MQPVWLCILFCKQFKDTFEKTQWRSAEKVEKSQTNVDEEFWALKRNSNMIGLIGISGTQGIMITGIMIIGILIVEFWTSTCIFIFVYF